LKDGTTYYRRQKHVLRSAPVRHWMSSIVSFALLVRSVVRLPESQEALSEDTNDLRNADETSQRTAGGDSSLTPEGVPTPFTVARSAMLSN
jgi:hypothetical protein